MILIYFWLTIFNGLQNEPCKVYVSNSSEIVGLCGDSIVYRLANGGGMTTLSYSKGTYKWCGQRVQINHSDFSIVKETVYENNPSLDKSTIIEVLDSEGCPAVAEPLFVIYDDNKIPYDTDTAGRVNLEDFDSNKYVTLKFIGLYYSFSHRMFLQSNKVNQILIKTGIGINNVERTYRDYLTIKSVNDQESIIMIFDPVLKEWKRFEKVEKNMSFKEVLKLIYKQVEL